VTATLSAKSVFITGSDRGISALTVDAPYRYSVRAPI
jgi:hypothetical protein